MVEHLIVAANSLGSVQTSLKKVGDMSKGVANTLSPPKKYKNKTLPNILELLNDIEKIGLLQYFVYPGTKTILIDHHPFFWH